MADATYAGVLAEKLDAVARLRTAQGLTRHGLLALLLAVNGFEGLPTRYLDAYKNSKYSITKETTLKGQKLQSAGEGREMQYRVLMDASDSYYESPVSFNSVTNFDATDDSNRLQFEMKNIRTQPMILALDELEMKNARLGNIDGFTSQVGQKIIKLLNGLARTLILGTGTGSAFNGIADHIKAIMNWEGETTGSWAAQTIGKLDQNANSAIRNHAYTTAISTALDSVVNACEFMARLNIAIDYAMRGGDNMVFGLVNLGTNSRLANALTLANVNLLGKREQWGNVRQASVDVLLGRHLMFDGVPFCVDTYVPTNYIYVSNMEILGLDWKGASPFKSTGIIDLAEVGAGYPIGSKGMQIEFQGNLCDCLPDASSVISSFSG